MVVLSCSCDLIPFYSSKGFVISKVAGTEERKWKETQINVINKYSNYNDVFFIRSITLKFNALVALTINFEIFKQYKSTKFYSGGINL